MPEATSTVSFVLDNQQVDLDLSTGPHRPTQTLLWYLRSLAAHKDVKEGCAEGDCGACTVVLAHEDESGKMRYTAHDSCLMFLPSLHGKTIYTANGIGSSNAMHPVQQAMVDCDGSQCGYCTPGFVMSMFALYKTHDNPSREVIDDALTGNLCRCTGYRSIVEAAAEACANRAMAKKVITATDTVAPKSIAIARNDQQYYRPTALAEALQLRNDHPNALLVNGGTDVGLMVTKQKKMLESVIDLSGLTELNHIEASATGITFGAGASLEKVKTHCAGKLTALYDMLAVFGSLQIRNNATLGGNVANASPIGDTPPVLMAYEAEITVQSSTGERTLNINDFITGYRTTALQPNELITKVFVPFPPAETTVRAYKISKRKDLDISTVSGGFRLRLNANNTVQEIRLIYGGMAAMTKRAAQAETFLTGKPWTRENAEAAMDLVEAEFTPISDARSGKEGRRVMARNLVLRFWADTQGIAR